MGVSTLYVARPMLEIANISSLSIDHDSSWIENCRDRLASKSLVSDRHSIVYAPLCRQRDIHEKEFDYYEPTTFKSAISNFSPDLVIIDTLQRGGMIYWKPVFLLIS